MNISMNAAARATRSFALATGISTAIGAGVSWGAERDPAHRDTVRHLTSIGQAFTGAALLVVGKRAAGLGALAGIGVTQLIDPPGPPHAQQRPTPLPGPATKPLRSDVVRDTRAIAEEAQAMFARFGISKAEGNSLEPLHFDFDPALENAYFTPGRSANAPPYPAPPSTDPRNNLDLPDGPAIVVGATSTGRPFSEAEDVITHEYTHWVLNQLDLRGPGQAGALNESIADTFGAVIDSDDWTLGEDLYEGGIRNMQTGEGRTGFLEWAMDSGGVHRRTAGPNRAAAIIGDTLGREAMGRLYGDAVQHLPRRLNFHNFGETLVASAQRIWGEDAPEVAVVRDAWAAGMEHA